MSFPHSAMGWYVGCDSGISWSYSCVFTVYIKLNNIQFHATYYRYCINNFGQGYKKSNICSVKMVKQRSYNLKFSMYVKKHFVES